MNKKNISSRTNIVLNKNLIRSAIALTGAKSKREVVDIALRELVVRKSISSQFKGIRHKLHWEGDLNALRKNRS